MTAAPVLANDAARKVFLDRHLLLGATTGPGRGADLDAVIGALGFVQIDSVNTFARAHDLILWSRRPQYRPPALGHLLDRDRRLFEHWTHDAAVLPIAQFPHWRLRFDRDRDRLHKNWQSGRPEGFPAQIDVVRRQIADHGACTSNDVGGDEPKGSGGWWDWHPSKTALEYLWRSGELSVVRRDGFRKVYDLTERVIPPEYLNARHPPEATIDWACNAALDRLGFATSGEIAAFWALATPAEARDWCDAALRRCDVEVIEVQGADGSLRRAFARPGLIEQARALPDPGARVRLLSPFDPALRDRKRAERLFSFSYRIEIFVPAPKRTFGYYVFPLMEGTRLIGRIDMKADRASETLAVTALWPEPGIGFGTGRQSRVMAELDRAARFAGCTTIDLAPGWLRDPARAPA